LASQLREPNSDLVDEILDRASTCLVSEFTAAEFASAVSRLYRMNAFSLAQARTILGDFDMWRARESEQVDIIGPDVHLAATYVRRFELKLRSPDALQLAIASRLAAPLVTLDRALAKAGEELGIATLIPGEAA
jgi:predicted nucleic acid-binding protein